ncbi:MAG TPA: hypothetical protein VNT60_01640 [Deinococcales bacterium]|nr:hypothetical protein [Deinococcales bacterium]
MMLNKMLSVEADGVDRELREDLAQGALVLAVLVVLNVLTLNWLPFMWSLVLCVAYAIAMFLRAAGTAEGSTS